MAKLSKIIKEQRRIALSNKDFKKREALKAIIKDPNVAYEEKQIAVTKLSKLPRDGSRSRVRRRCQQTKCGRPHANTRQFGLCRIHIIEAFNRADIPGLVKASW